MCGFAGQLRLDGGLADARVVARMARRVAHRGPDDAGMLVEGPIALAHHRLAILDRSERAAQPMQRGGLALVFNGCIYNFRELRAELEAEGMAFESDGDTEVVLAAFAVWGPKCVERFDGMFAFAIYDRLAGRLTLARDRFGIKPLYWAATARSIVFASTLPAVRLVEGVDTAIDPVGLHHYLTLHGIVPAPRTILRGVHKLPAATWMQIDLERRTDDRRYFEVRFEPDPGPSADEWAEEVSTRLFAAVQRRTVADVPFGVLLSGGLDSSLIVAMLHGTAATYSIGFDSAGDVAGDEFVWSDSVAQQFKTQHQRWLVSAEHVLANLQACIAAMSEPMVSHDAIGFFLLASHVAQHRSVVLTGQGADELFAGYHWYRGLHRPQAAVGDYAQAFFDRSSAAIRAMVVPDLVPDDDVSRAFVERWFSDAPAASTLDRALHLDLNVMLVEDPLARVDHMTMAAALEARVPFVDHQLVRLAATIPAEHKLADGGKGVLKGAARRWLPDAIIDRPKGYFPVPMLTQPSGPIRALLEETLRRSTLFRSSFVEELLARPERHRTPLGVSTLWQLGVLSLWLQSGSQSPAS